MKEEDEEEGVVDEGGAVLRSRGVSRRLVTPHVLPSTAQAKGRRGKSGEEEAKEEEDEERDVEDCASDSDGERGLE